MKHTLLTLLFGCASTAAVHADQIGHGDPLTSDGITCATTDCPATEDTSLTSETETSLWQQLLEMLGTNSTAE